MLSFLKKPFIEKQKMVDDPQQKELKLHEEAQDKIVTLISLLEELKTLHESRSDMALITKCFDKIKAYNEFTSQTAKKPSKENPFLNLVTMHLRLIQPHLDNEILLKENGQRIQGREEALAHFNQFHALVISSLQRTMDEQNISIHHLNTSIAKRPG